MAKMRNYQEFHQEKGVKVEYRVARGVDEDDDQIIDNTYTFKITIF